MTNGDENLFIIGTALFCLILDGALSLWLFRRGTAPAFAFWLVFGMALAPMVVTRLDLIPGVLVAAAAIWLATRPRLSAAILGVATMAKLWPLALVTGLVGRWNSRGTWARLLSWAGAIMALTALTTLTTGWWRVLSPFQYQHDRGLQSESVLATPLIWAAHFSDHWDIRLAASKSFEVFGTGVVFALGVSTVLSVLTALFALLVTVSRFFGSRAYSPAATRAYWLSLALLIVVTAKVFSPQYLLWIAPLVAVLLALDGGRHLKIISGLLLLAALLSTVVFPLFFDDFTGEHTGLGPTLLTTVALTLRNIIMIAITVISCDWTRRTLRAEFSADRGAPRIPEEVGASISVGDGAPRR
ncbi:hypothetical protein [Corynebacterium pacaense]|uniref:hypothetical protein n=1 Tax=Corynebacterium pacaense TaxID=1816684 RepID=UPI0009BC6F1F|nr:hypothetical protein [Corynebacterium pacaense]